jgi:putative flippase GtrA
MTTASVCLMTRRRTLSTARPAGEHHPHRLARFVVVGGGATALQLGLFALLQVFVPVFWANVIAWGASTVVGNQVHRTLTFGRHGRAGARRDFVVSTAFSLLSLSVTTLALTPVDDDQPVTAVVVLIAVNSVVGLARFVGLRRWFAGHTTVAVPA